MDRDPAWVVEGAELIRADLARPGGASGSAGMDAVCHQAARVGLGVDFADAPATWPDNQLATAPWPPWQPAGFAGRLVLASSMVVYGEGRYRCATARRGPGRAPPGRRSGRRPLRPVLPACGAPLSWAAVDESAPLDPRSVYTATKVGQEHLCASWARRPAAGPGPAWWPCATTTCTGPASPSTPPTPGVAALWCTALRRGGAPRVFEDGRQTRDFVHVTDVAAANLAALEVPLPGGSFEAVNVCSGEPVSILDVAAGLADAFGPAAPARS